MKRKLKIFYGTLLYGKGGHATPLFGEVNSPNSPPAGSRAPKAPETRGALDATRRAVPCPPPSRCRGRAPSPREHLLILLTLILAIVLGGLAAAAQEAPPAPPEEETQPPEAGEETPGETGEAAPGEETTPPEAPPPAEETAAAPEAGAAPAEEAPPPVEATPPAEAVAPAEAGAGGEAKAGAVVSLEAEAAPAPKKSSFRNSYFIYENTFNAYTLKRDAQLTFNPYYAMSYSFRPRYYIWKDLYVGLRWDLEQELTNADDTTKKHQVIWSDVILDFNWNLAAKIPKIDVIFNPKIRFELPASLASQAKTLYLSLGPGFDFMKIFDVWGGITLQWAFRYTKYFNQYTGALSEEPVLECNETGPCQYDVIGPQNPSMRFSNVFYLEVRPIAPLAVSATVEIRNYLLYKVPDTTVETMAGTVTVPSSGATHSAYMWYVFDVSYDVLPYLTLSLGTSTYNPQLNPSSEYYPPFFNRFTNIYFDIAVDVDGMVHGIMKKGKGKTKSATERL